jgi:hypothetical protein
MHLQPVHFAFSVVVAAALSGCSAPQRSFDSPEAAVSALQRAVGDADHDELRAVFGPRYPDLTSGDTEQDRSDFAAFTDKVNERATIEPVNDGEAIVRIGAEAWPFAVPLVRANGRWRFDTEAGITELTNRRISENERATIEACASIIDAEAEYGAADYDDDGVGEYTARLLSSPGTRDGLYWETGENEMTSPLGPVIAAATIGPDGAGDPYPFYGYLFLLLERQGAAAPGGALEYGVDGNIVNGIAGVALPAEYGRTGIMTFIFSVDGAIYQRDLGPDTGSIARGMTVFDPGEGWQRVERVEGE